MTKTQIADTKDVRIEDLGDGFMHVTCKCCVCKGKTAKNKGNGIDPRTGRKYDRTFIHNIVLLAHGPFARAESQIKSGPWAA